MTEWLSAIYTGTVIHHRLIPRRHRFHYRVFSLCLELDELPRLDQGLRLFSLNRFNLFSFHERDHGRGGGQLKREIVELLQQRGHGSATARIRLLCYPRILGYVFNPLSVFFCYNQAGQLEVILYEVSNTFRQRHCYLLAVDPAQTTAQTTIVRQRCSKQMYVSPFMPMATRYGFRIQPPNQRVSICIRQSELHGEQPILHASFTGERQSLTDRTLWRLFVSYPLMTLKVVAAIHWQALRLWQKQIRLQPRPTGNRYSISWQDQHGVTRYEIH